MADEYDPEGISADEETSPTKRHEHRVEHHGKKESRGGLVATAVFSGIAVVAIGAIPGLGWSLFLPAFAGSLVLAWQAHYGAIAVGSLMRAGYDAPITKQVANLAQSGTSAVANYLTWQLFPFNLDALGLPGFVGTIARYAFLIGAVGSTIVTLVRGIRLVFGKKTGAQDPDEDN